jgi:hypothetical protein
LKFREMYDNLTKKWRKLKASDAFPFIHPWMNTVALQFGDEDVVILWSY